MGKSPKKEKVWCKVADIPENTVYMMSVIRGMFDIWPNRGLGNYVKEYFTLFQGDFSEMCYPREEFDRQAEFLSKKMIARPDWAIQIIDGIEKWSNKFFQVAKKQFSANHARLTDKELIDLFKLSQRVRMESHGIGFSVSWHADAEKERVTKAIVNMLSMVVGSRNLNFIVPVIFSKLSTPSKQSIIEKEEKDFLRIAIQINANQKSKNLFLAKRSLTSLKDDLERHHRSLYNKIINHYKKYRWLPYQYKGPAYNLSDFLGRWQAVLKGEIKPDMILVKLDLKRKNLKKEQQTILKELKLDQYQKNLIILSQRLVFIKDYRKMALYHAMFCLEPVFKEIGKRLGLSLEQVRAMDYGEILTSLAAKKDYSLELNQRLKKCAVYYSKKRSIIYTGVEFDKFIRSIVFERKINKKAKEMSGTCACPGLVRGIVKIINLPKDMVKMKVGNILVAHNTNPNLVPAMKKAAAMVGEAGGLTCHTAIVARELNIPCVVGVAGADKILKDGDRVEVDATNAIIKKI